MKYLVPGAVCFIGSNAVRKLLKDNYAIRDFDNLSTGKRKNLECLEKKDNFEFIEGNLKNPEKTKRILTIAPIDISKGLGSKIHFTNLNISFEKLGITTRSIIYFSEGSKKYKLNTNMDIRFVPNPLVGNVFFRALKYLSAIPFVILETFRFKPDLIYIRFSAPALLYQLVLKFLNFLMLDFKVMLEFNDWVAEQRALEGHSRLKIFIVAKLQLGSAFLANYIRVVAEGIKEKLLSFNIDAQKIDVIENGTDIDLFKPINRDKAKELIGVDPKKIYVGFIGMFAVWQGLDHLLCAIPQVLKVRKDIRFLLVGDGPLMPKIRETVSNFEKGKVILTGNVPYSEANLYINAFDIGVAPFIKKRNDGMISPMKIRDYAACGVPIITTKIRGLEMVEERNIGILVPPDDSNALAKAIITLSGDQRTKYKMGKKGRKVAEELFSWKNVAEQILNNIMD